MTARTVRAAPAERSPLLRGSARLLRGSVLAAACLAVSTAAHATACGVTLDVGLLLSVAITMGLGLAWAQRRARTATLVAFVLACQVLLHVVSVLASAHHSSASLIPSPSMIAWHAMAAVLMAVLLAHADTIAHRWAAFLHALRWPAPALPGIPLIAGAQPPAEPAPSTWRHDPAYRIQRRGPPFSK
ncbi:MAG: hypothetical protein KGP12_12295 [Actinomycetales bacterium]|nr:hypothetical protein [Actinomycetales bacterium]